MSPEQPTGMRTTWLKAVFWLSLMGLTTLSLVPVDHLPDQVMDIWDKAQHALGFAWLGMWGLLAYPRHVRWVLLGLLVWGGVIELMQWATGWRQGDVLDGLADAVGVALAWLIWRALSTRRRATP